MDNRTTRRAFFKKKSQGKDIETIILGHRSCLVKTWKPQTCMCGSATCLNTIPAGQKALKVMGMDIYICIPCFERWIKTL